MAGLSVDVSTSGDARDSFDTGSASVGLSITSCTVAVAEGNTVSPVAAAVGVSVATGCDVPVAAGIDVVAGSASEAAETCSSQFATEYPVPRPGQFSRYHWYPFADVGPEITEQVVPAGKTVTTVPLVLGVWRKLTPSVVWTVLPAGNPPLVVGVRVGVRLGVRVAVAVAPDVTAK